MEQAYTGVWEATRKLWHKPELLENKAEKGSGGVKRRGLERPRSAERGCSMTSLAVRR